MDPVLEEMRRAKEVRDGSVRKWADYFTFRLAADADTIAALTVENAGLRAELASRKGRAA